MGQLHELLAVEGDIEGIAKKIIEETVKVFSDKPALFIGFNRHLEMFAEDDSENHQGIEDHQEITETVSNKLDYMSDHVKRYFDSLLQKELTNQTAKADLIVDGLIIAKDLPATFLLGLESRLKNLRRVYEAIPTLAPGIKWLPDETKGQNIWAADRPEERYKTAKAFKSQVLVEATEHHPAQVEKWEETVNVGKYVNKRWCGMLSPAQKSMMLARIDKLIRAVKKGRQRANKAEVEVRNIGAELFAFIHKI